MAFDRQGTATHRPKLRRLKTIGDVRSPPHRWDARGSDTPRGSAAMFEPMPDDDDDDELDDVGLLTREAPAAKATKAKSAPREKPAPKSSAWELTGNAELDALFQSSTLTARSLNVAASRPSTTGPSSGKPLRSTPVEVPLSRAEKILAKLAEQKEEDDKESKKLDRQRKRVEDDARAEAAAERARRRRGSRRARRGTAQGCHPAQGCHRRESREGRSRARGRRRRLGRDAGASRRRARAVRRRLRARRVSDTRPTPVRSAGQLCREHAEEREGRAVGRQGHRRRRRGGCETARRRRGGRRRARAEGGDRRRVARAGVPHRAARRGGGRGGG